MAFSPRVQQPMRKAEATSQAQLERCELSLCKLHRQSSARSRYGSTERDREDAQVTERFDAVNITAAHRVQHRRLPKAAPPAEVASPVGSSPEHAIRHESSVRLHARVVGIPKALQARLLIPSFVEEACTVRTVGRPVGLATDPVERAQHGACDVKAAQDHHA